MLEKYALTVDTVNSAGEALDYLIHNRPDVIFMDHMMPGMNGFEAVKAIKINPATATIPILMYTTKSGDLYLGQARALGAVGVLPKTVAPAELFNALERLGLVKDRREEAEGTDDETASERAPDIEQRGAGAASFYDPHMPVNTRTSPPDELDTRIRRLLEEQRVELRKDILLSMESVSKRVGMKFEHEFDAKLGELAAREEPAPHAAMLPVVLLGMLLLASLAWNYALHQDFKAFQEASESSRQDAAQQRPAERIDTADEAVAIPPSPNWAFLDWAMNQTLSYPYNEIALDNTRLDTVETMLELLAGSGFKGKVVLQTHVGEFCLLGNEQHGYRLPPPELPVEQCDLIGNPLQQTDTPATHQSLQFANFYNTNPYLADGSLIRLEIIAMPRSIPLVDYPVRGGGTTALEWNTAAASNNRVVLSLQPQ
jgi:CheY-like chemotaxis protein